MRGARAAIPRLLAAIAYGRPCASAAAAYAAVPAPLTYDDAYRPFFILGEVAAPGQYPDVPNVSVESAVAVAGGFSPRALRDRVTLTHTDGSGWSRMAAPLGTAFGPGETILAGERWF